MDLFEVINMEVPTGVTIGMRPLREGEVPILQAVEGRLTDLVLPGGEGSSAASGAAPIQQIAPTEQQESAAEPEVEQPPPKVAPIELSTSEEEEEESEPLKRKRARSEDGEGTSKKARSGGEIEQSEPILTIQ